MLALAMFHSWQGCPSHKLRPYGGEIKVRHGIASHDINKKSDTTLTVP